ncbi:MAG: hypothetical protein H6876_03630 [Hyphomicrobiaceae bacterium]|nr:hypothetical protein [Hyphomicrobiaceae bacterium]
MVPFLAAAEEKTSITSGLTEAELTPKKKAEREARKSCKVELCRAFRNQVRRAATSPARSRNHGARPNSTRWCQAKVSWPWGPVVCKADIDIEREMITKAMSEAKYDLVLKTHHVACTVEREAKDDAKIDIDFAPTVTFENGKAVKAKINWGTLSAPTLLKGAMWTATATDNTFNVLQSTLVDDINDFVSKKCDEVKDDWSKPAP